MPAERAVTGERLLIINNANLYGGGDGGVCARALADACASVRWHACVRDVFAIYDNKI